MGVTRAAHQATPLVRELAMRGLRSARIPAIAVEHPDGAGVAAALAALPPRAWVVVTSPNGARSICDIRGDLRWAAVGRGTADALERAGARDVWTPTRSDGATLAAELPVAAEDACLLVRGDLADPAVADRIRARGADVRGVVAYRTVEGPAASRRALAGALAAGLAGVTFASGSAVRGFLSLADGVGADVLGLPAVCVGPRTADVARASGFRTVMTAKAPGDDALAELAAATVAVPA